jgi:hypothetical protein
LSFVLRGGEALKSITDPARRNTAGSDWLLSMGRILTADIQEHARTGRWTQVAGVAEQMQVLVDQTKPGLTQAGLRGMQVKVRNLLGEAEVGAQLLDQGLAEVAGLGTRLDRAEALRSLAHESGDPGSPRVAAAVSVQVQALDGQKGLDVALALGKLALLHADAGRFDAHAALKARALLVPGLSARDTRILETELNTGAGLAKAEQLHRAGKFGEAEKAVRQLAYQLL